MHASCYKVFWLYSSSLLPLCLVPLSYVGVAIVISYVTFLLLLPLLLAYTSVLHACNLTYMRTYIQTLVV